MSIKVKSLLFLVTFFNVALSEQKSETVSSEVVYCIPTPDYLVPHLKKHGLYSTQRLLLHPLIYAKYMGPEFSTCELVKNYFALLTAVVMSKVSFGSDADFINCIPCFPLDPESVGDGIGVVVNTSKAYVENNMIKDDQERVKSRMLLKDLFQKDELAKNMETENPDKSVRSDQFTAQPYLDSSSNKKGQWKFDYFPHIYIAQSYISPEQLVFKTSQEQ